jgi:tetratricopeptide (TPR) repeat protein
LSAFFWLLAIISYSRYVRQPSMVKYLLVFLAMALGLMSKPMVVTLPFVLLLLDFWPLSRLERHAQISGARAFSVKQVWPLVWEKIPFFLLAAVSSIVTINAQKSGGAVIPIEALGFGTRVGNAIHSYFIYMWKMFLPLDLGVLYPHQIIPALKIIGATFVLVSISVLAIRLRKKHPYFLVGWLWYVGTMVPIIGLVQVGHQAMADRYTYIPLIGLFIVLSWAISELFGKLSRGKLWATLSGALLLPLMMAVAWVQVGYWKNSITLWQRTLSVSTDNSIAHNNLGEAYHIEGQILTAREQYQLALKINPKFAMAHNNLGKSLYELGEAQDAIEHYLRALQINPNLAMTHNNLGNALKKQGQIQQALEHYQMALEINPDFEIAHYNLGVAFEETGSRDMAIKHFQKAILINPDFADAHYNLGIILMRAGQQKMANFHLRRATEIESVRR